MELLFQGKFVGLWVVFPIILMQFKTRPCLAVSGEVPTFHVTRIRLRLKVELREDGLWISTARAQRRLNRVMESLFKSSRLQLPGV